ncbi:MAG: hypothetical protein L0271_06445 [Gemmatimonadetes bacterium]|nr:hypothetical protein [Gemmatimonadota bacterium]
MSRLLRRAAELQRSTPASPDPSGLTLAELESIAQEAGPDGAHLRRAALELEAAGSLTFPARVGPALAGAPLRIVLEHTLPIEPPETAFAVLVPIIQIAADAPGQASQVGRTLSWHSQNPANPRGLQIIISVRPGETHIRIEERYAGLAAAVFAGGVGGVGMGVGIGAGGAIGGMLGSVALAIGLPAAVLVSTYLGGRALYSSIVRRRTRVLEALLQRIIEELNSAARKPIQP